MPVFFIKLCSKKMERGYVKLYRKMQSKGWYKNSKYVHLWCHILMKANHKEAEFMWNGEMIIVKRGQFITGRNQLSDETGITKSTIENILRCFENGHQIGQQKTNKFRLITVIKWKEYQQDGQQNGQQSDNRVTSNGQQSDTNKNDKNDKNEKNEKEREGDALRAYSPAQVANDFLNISEKQEEAISKLLGNGIPETIARQEVKKFVAYWTELNGSGSKQRWQMQKTFEVQKRLATWFGKVGSFNKSTRREKKTGYTKAF